MAADFFFHCFFTFLASGGQNMRLINKSNKIILFCHILLGHMQLFCFFLFGQEVQNGSKMAKICQKKGQNSPFFCGPKAHYWSFSGPKAHYWSFPHVCVRAWPLYDYGQYGCVGRRPTYPSPPQGLGFFGVKRQKILVIQIYIFKTSLIFYLIELIWRVQFWFCQMIN